MATPSPSVSPFALTGDSLIDASTSGYRWLLNADRTVDWSISGGTAGEVWVDPASVRDHLADALGVFSYYANIRFNYVGSFTTPAAAALAGSEINVFASASTAIFPSTAYWAVGFSPRAADGYVAGDVVLNLNSQANRLSSYEPGSAGWALMLHELGHATGLKHPHDDGGTGRPTLDSLGIAALDEDWFTVMSYQDDFDWNLLSWDPATLMLLDVLGLQYLYGANTTTNLGDTSYALANDGYYVTIWDAGGNDTITAAGSAVGWDIDLPSISLSTLVPTLLGSAVLLSEKNSKSPHVLRWLMGDIENAIGSSAADEIEGNLLANVLRGGGGNDLIDGAGGVDTAAYSGASAQYSWTARTGGGWTVTDLRAGSPDGTDTLIDMEVLSFTDRQVQLGVAPPLSAGAAITNILRLDASTSAYTALLNLLSGQPSTSTVAALTQLADATTSVATLAYQFFTGKIPGLGGIDYLVSPTGPNPNNLNSAYYQSFNLENRYINFAFNLGKNGDGAASFLAGFGGRTLFDTVKAAYTTIFGVTPTDAKVHALIDSRIDYFASYGRDGAEGIGTKAAAVGWLLAEAVKADVGMYAKANDAFLQDLADGANFAVDLVGTYGKPEFSVF